jgi:hypothetical protein
MASKLQWEEGNRNGITGTSSSLPVYAANRRNIEICEISVESVAKSIAYKEEHVGRNDEGML